MLPWERREQIRDAVVGYRWYDNPSTAKALVKTRSFVRMGLATLLTDDERKAVMGWMLREDRKPIGTKDLTGAEVMALSDWVKPGYKPASAFGAGDGEFLIGEEFRSEIKWVLWEVKNGAMSKTADQFSFD